MLTYDSVMQDDIALLVSGRSHDALSDDQKKLIDNNWSSGSLTGGAAKRAFDLLAPWGEFFTTDATAGIPDEFRSWFIDQAAAMCVARFETADKRTILSSLSNSRRSALDSYSRSSVDSVSSSDHLLGTVIGVRSYVVVHTLRMARPLLPEPYMIDQALQEAMRDTWMAADWSFQKQTVTLTIGTDSSVTVGGSLILKRITTDKAFFSSANATGQVMIPVDAETMIELQNRGLSAGRPQYFRVLADAGGADGGLRFEFERTPDQEYTVKVEAKVSLGAMTTIAEMGTAIGTFPVGMVPYLKKKTLATVLENASRTSEARAIEHECDDLLGSLIQEENPLSDQVHDQDRPRRRGMGRAPINNRIGGFL